MKGVLVSTLSVLFLLILWQIAALAVDAPLILPSPLTVFIRLITELGRGNFFAHFLSTGARVLLSFLASLFLGTILGILSGLHSGARQLLAPLLLTIRTVPVMAVILIAILYFSSTMVPVFAALLMALPMVAGAIEGAIRGLDHDLMEMAQVFRLSGSEKLKRIVIPQLIPVIYSAAHISIGLCWKVVIAGEILSIPRLGIGSRMQLAQLSLETAEVLAWTVTAIGGAGISQLFFRLSDRKRRRL
jgi:NitT/TauT family transport system permease protein